MVRLLQVGVQACQAQVAAAAEFRLLGMTELLVLSTPVLMFNPATVTPLLTVFWLMVSVVMVLAWVPSCLCWTSRCLRMAWWSALETYWLIVAPSLWTAAEPMTPRTQLVRLLLA